MNSNRLPSDALTKRATPIRTALIAVSSVAVVAGLSIGGVTLTAAINHPTPTATAFQPAEQTGSVNAAPYVDPTQEAAAAAQEAALEAAQAAAVKAAADAAAQAAADAAAQQAAAAASRQANRSSNAGGLPSGATVPLNSFGSPDTTKCASGSASDNASGVAVCD